jgi:EmrB/QacA subfamily drug resistance transporter
MTTATSRAPARPEPGSDPPLLAPHERISPRRRLAVLAAMCLALVLVVASVSMLAVGLPSVSESLGLSQTASTWVVDAYALTLASLLMVAGALGDRFGRKRAFVVGVTIFGLGSLLSAFANDGGQLIAFRAMTGVGGALMMPGTLSTITSVFPPEERARAVGIWAGFAGAGGTLGMLAAGWMLGTFTWHSLFYVSATLSAVVLALAVLVVPETRSSEHVGLDPVGTVLSALGVGALVLGIIEGPSRGWTEPLTVVGLVVGVVLLGAFVLWELRVEHPLLDPRLFRHRGFATGSASMLVLFMVMFGLFLVLLQYLQLVLGYSALKSAVALLPMTFVMIPMSASAAVIAERFGQRIVGGGGIAIGALGMLALSTLDATSGYGPLLVAQVILAVGIGLAMTPATNAIVSSLPPSKQGVASAVNDTTREIGTALGIAIMGSLFTTGYRSAVEGNLGALPADVADQAKEAPGLALAIAGKLGPAGDALANAARDAFGSGMRVSLYGGAAMLLGVALFIWLWGPSKRQELSEDLLDEGLAIDADDADDVVVTAHDDRPTTLDGQVVPAFAGD